MNLLLLHLFAREATETLAGRRIDAVRWYPPVLSLSLGGRGKAHIVAVLGRPGPFAWRMRGRPLEGAQAPKRFRALAGATIAALEPRGRDRVLRILARRGDGPPLALDLYMYGAAPRVLLTRGDSTVESIGRRDQEADAAPDDRPTLVDADAATLDSIFGPEAPALESPPQAVVPGIDAELLLAFAHPDGGVDAASLATFRDALLSGRGRFALTWGRSPADAVPVPADAAGGERRAGPFDRPLDACETLGGEVLARARQAIVHSLARPFRRRLASNRRLRRNLGKDIERAHEHERLRREAEILAAFQATIPAGAPSATLDDIYRPGETVTIELDPLSPLHEQIERRFRTARRLAKRLEHAGRRIELVETESNEIEALLSLLQETDSLAQTLLRLEAARARFGVEAVATRGGAEPGGRPPEGKTLRRFELADGWFVIVGRNTRDNDEVTFKHAAPNDLWFHAQGVSGSHVVLKRRRGGIDNPPASIIEQVASIAAHFSKSRHSALAPVIYTRRKYVRKFRGARPGQVRCEREKMVMVAPRLPEPASAP